MKILSGAHYTRNSFSVSYHSEEKNTRGIFPILTSCVLFSCTLHIYQIHKKITISKHGQDWYGANIEKSSKYSSNCTMPFTSRKDNPIKHNETYIPPRRQYCYCPKKYEKVKAAKQRGQTLRDSLQEDMNEDIFPSSPTPNSQHQNK